MKRQSAEILLQGVRLAYPGHAALPSVSARIPGGSLTAIAGANGSGKSTLLKAIAGLMKPVHGTLTREGFPSVAYLTQTSELPRDFPIDVEGLVAMGLWRRRGGLSAIRCRDRREIAEALDAVGLSGFARRTVAALSAGQFQRTLFARLIVEDASLILLDEPFNAVDAATVEGLLELIARWHAEGRTVLCALHERSRIERHFDYCLTLGADGATWQELPRAASPAAEKVIPLSRKGTAVLTFYQLAVAPFTHYGFMGRALAACTALSIGSAPIGVLLVLRRMALVGDALSHAILPGVALAYLLFGLALWPMTLGGLIAGLLVAGLAGLLTRLTPLKEDASFTGLYLISLSTGVLLVSLKGGSVDLMHVLFGNVLAVDTPALLLISGVATISALSMACAYRGMIAECLDASFLRVAGGKGGRFHLLFLVLLVLNLVAAFQALGTLMALGLMVLPGIAARLWVRHIDAAIPFSIAYAALSAYGGLLLSYHAGLPSGPSIVLVGGAFYLASILLAPQGLLRLLPRRAVA